MDQEKIKHFKEKLLSEKKRLETELSDLGRVNPSNPKDWEAVPGDDTVSHSADENEAADRIEQFEENTAILKQLETQLNDVNDALQKIDAGTYGVCEVSGEQIPLERLEANPAARTTIEHANE